MMEALVKIGPYPSLSFRFLPIMIMRSVLAVLASAIATTQVLAASNDAATPEDVLNSMKDVNKLSANTHSHAKEIGTDFNRKHFILGACASYGVDANAQTNTLPRTHTLAVGIRSRGLRRLMMNLRPNPRRHSTIKAKRIFAQRFTWYVKGCITPCEYSHWTYGIWQFEHRQFLLVVTLINEPRSIESGGFDGYFEDCFTRLKPALTGFIRRLADYAPSCRDKIIKNNGQLERAFDGAIKKIKHR
jgi:hypothetical protein